MQNKVAFAEPKEIMSSVGKNVFHMSVSSIGSNVVKDLVELHELAESQKHRRRSNICRMMIIILVPVAGLLIVTGLSLRKSIENHAEVMDARSHLKDTLFIVELIKELQKERGINTMYLSSNESEVVYERVRQQMGLTDGVLRQVLDMGWRSLSVNNEEFTDGRKLHQSINKHRRKVRRESIVFLERNIWFYTNITLALIDTLSARIIFPRSTLWAKYACLLSLISATDNVGIQRALGSGFFASCSSQNQHWFRTLDIEHRSYLDIAFGFHAETGEDFEGKLGKTPSLMADIQNMKRQILAVDATNDCLVTSGTTGSNIETGLLWFENITVYLQAIIDVAYEIRVDIIDEFDAIARSISDDLFVNIFVIAATLLTCIMTTVWYIYRVKDMTEQISSTVVTCFKKTQELAWEKKRTECLLFELLPKNVANQLMVGREVKPELFESVTILFSDIVDFSSIAASCSPSDVVDFLNGLYSLFEGVLEKYDVYKVETIGDEYMVASGVPVKNDSHHVTEIACLSLDLLKAIKHVTHDNVAVQLRIGFHSGQVAAGVVGLRMPRYCLFGDTVNTAARMEKSGKPLRIHISQSTNSMLEQLGWFETEYRGLVEVKGKGNMHTYWLTSRLEEIR